MSSFVVIYIVFLTAALLLASGVKSYGNAQQNNELKASFICQAIKKSAKKRGLNPSFLARLLWQESRFNINAVSPKGAQGIAQFMPGTAKMYDLRNPFDPISSIDAASRLLSDLHNDFGNLGLAAAAYNAGSHRVRRWIMGENTLPFETKDYVSIITGHNANHWKKEKVPFVAYRIFSDTPFLQGCKQLALRSRHLPRHTGGNDSLPASFPWGAQLLVGKTKNSVLKKFAEFKSQRPSFFKSAELMMVKTKISNKNRAARWALRLGTASAAEAARFCNKAKRVSWNCQVRKTK